jgi:ATP-dependent Lon protease
MSKTQHLPILPLQEQVILPHMSILIDGNDPEVKLALAAARRQEDLLLVIPVIKGKYSSIGTVVKLGNSQSAGPSLAQEIHGLYRGKINSGAENLTGELWVDIVVYEDPEKLSGKVTELGNEYRALVESLMEAHNLPPTVLRNIQGVSQLTDMSGYSPELTVEQRLELLETLDLGERLTKLIGWTEEILAIARIRNKAKQDVEERLNSKQREYIIKEQIAVLQKELGEGGGDIIAEYRKKIELANIPEGPLKEATKELERLERTSEQSPEHGWIRTYLDWMTDIPWDIRTEDNFDLKAARAVLDADHTGLDEVKDRVIEFLAVKKRRQGKAPEELTHTTRGSGVIIGFVGPPGVGKTSMGESIAKALGRKFARISLGGIRDEADIRGHRRTYVGALPGRIVRALKDTGTINPVILLDEVDKITQGGWSGDPASALLEVLDPAQNHTFRDHYLDVDLDLSEVLFIPTGNVADTIPGPLLDRMELLRLDGYTEDEKLDIAIDHLLPRQLELNGLTKKDVKITNAALKEMISSYTREAGCRNLERMIGKVLRKVTTQLDTGDIKTPAKIDKKDLTKYLRKPIYEDETADRTSIPGVATGLAVTGAGGDVLFIEATAMKGEDKLILTGQLGDVMKESAQIALSYVRSHPNLAVIDFEKNQFHLHVPNQSVPKDGPSAGITMVTAIVSLLTGRPVKKTVAMTGEVSLRGKILPIGGLKQKLLAAHRFGITEVIIPLRNKPDLEDVPESVLRDLKIYPVDNVSEVIKLALEPKRKVKAVA